MLENYGYIQITITLSKIINYFEIKKVWWIEHLTYINEEFGMRILNKNKNLINKNRN